MNRDKHDADILRTFTNKASAMDADFKSKLKKDMLKYDAKLAKGRDVKRPSRGLRFSWPKLVLAPAAVFAVAAIVGIALFNSGDVRKPLDSPKVSAQEVISRSRTSYKPSDSSNYNFYSLEIDTKAGDRYAKCMTDGSNGPKAEDVTSTERHYVYYGGRVAAMFNKSTIGKVDRQSSYYASNFDGAKESIWITQADNGGLPATSYEFDEENTGGQPSFVYVDKQGRQVSGDAPLTAEQRDGRSVYVFYVRMINGYGLSNWCADNIVELTYDVTSYAEVERTTYDMSVKPENLVLKYRYDLRYDNKSETEALKVMASDGFDKSNASSTFPQGGHDGEGEGSI